MTYPYVHVKLVKCNCVKKNVWVFLLVSNKDIVDLLVEVIGVFDLELEGRTQEGTIHVPHGQAQGWTVLR